ncbi:MAG: hypothetical protein LBM98_04365 [Oscillospiraceae bacterium]|nr:hypothetical protein [Oscillospiraceae bacterium]
MRYVLCYRREAIQCRGDNLRMLRARHWIAAPVYSVNSYQISDIRDVGLDGGCALRGNHPGATRHPSQEGNLRRKLSQPRNPATHVQTHSPLGRGAARRRRGGSPRRAHPTSNPSSLISDIC